MAFERLIGAYHADGGLMGELSCPVGKVRGAAHCPLCDIAHQVLWTKAEWRTPCGMMALDHSLASRAAPEGARRAR